ncbi:MULTISPECIES: bifunctional molybdenum cofactor biosynthesis protein MoaC/MoaB [unclassified Leifsonia]|uniref:bifunctional molybdenum cofactor biosynthesis protein MoaC/MoaB n=1 Tax=unclassified Leifsonia TaxID=2663824 RepID=UPI0006FE8583|nr:MULTISPECIES: bifunctional molybdenum cofactor biosynthesis protein MoaC/MoaB [unclassified Leifsonia]KQX05603.1 molybdenum cofactor biosynthesis protein [Leifsonia sp. Root1293]KRA09237.1 molybdenum cofactor biosynthesis protein [Leifsonia sp. Root60]
MTDHHEHHDAAALSHVDDQGRARMIDVGGKAVTRRVAVATGRLTTTPEVVALVIADGMPKADVLATARIAGIQGAKRTSELIPLCHLLPLDSVTIEFGFDEDSIDIRAQVSVTGRTGVEMEALTAVAIAGLTLHDMVKAVDPGAELGSIRLLEKTGGKRGHWVAEGASGDLLVDAAAPGAAPGASADVAPDAAPDAPVASLGSAVVIVASTSAAAGTSTDATGPVIVDWLQAAGYAIEAPVVVADADIASALDEALAGSPRIILTTGGTGLHPQDRTPEATSARLDRELPGIAEAIRAAGRAVTPTAALSRAVAGLAGDTIIVNLPGSPGGVRDGLAVLAEVLPHLVDQLAGGGHGGHHA